ncbi:MAG: hypothetical protein AAGH88_04795 [Planctomycetota bacterium]
MESIRTRLLWALVLLVAGLLWSCESAGPAPQDALDVALDRGQTTTRRLRAVPAIPSGQTDALYSLVWSSAHPMTIRTAAVDRLIAEDGPVFWSRIDQRINWVDDWPMIRLLCDMAVASGTTSFVPTAVKSWARPSTTIPDSERPERGAIAALVPAVSPEGVVGAYVRSAPDATSGGEALQQSAWAVLSRIGGDAEQRRVLAAAGDADPFLGPLRIVALVLDQLPADRESLLRMKSVIAESTADQWQDRRAYRGQRLREGDPGIALRHLPAIDRTGGYRMERREAVFLELRERLSGRRHFARGDGAEEAYVEPRPEQLLDHADRLGRADLLVLLLIDDAMQQKSVRRSLFEQAQADRDDTGTEYGGVLVWDEKGEVVARPFAPAMRRDDRVYFASDACVTAMHTGLAHYHFHAQQPNNAAWAGPGGGDIRFANALHANCVVFTSIDTNTLNVDAYLPGGIVVDMGCIKRP